MNKINSVKKFIIFGFATYGVLWTIVESYSSFFEGNKPQGAFAYIVMITLSIFVAIYKSSPKHSIELKVPNSDSKVVVKYGDIFEEKGCIAIPVNEFFDSKLGRCVSENSIHGIFIKNVLAGQSVSFDNLVLPCLENQSSNFCNEKNDGNKNAYKIGTTAAINVNNKLYFLFALAKTDPSNLKAYASIHELWDSLAGLWEEVRVSHNGYNVSIPLAGSGLSGIGLPAKNLLDIIIISFFYYTKKNKIVDVLTIVLHERFKNEIDLSLLEANWE